jgi:outer membrane protein OmpA-like peptidoglycan-associated protein
MQETDADRGAEAADEGASVTTPAAVAQVLREPTLPAAEERVEQSAGAPAAAPPPLGSGVDEAQARAQGHAASDAGVAAQAEPERPADAEADLMGASEKPAEGAAPTPENSVLEVGAETSAPRGGAVGKVRFSDQVLFAIDSTRIRPRYRQKLDQVAALVKGSSSTVEIVGYADRLGPPAYNLDLSRRRAEAVADYLAGKGVSTDRLRAEGRGPRSPEYPGGNESQQANWQDRVVEVSVVPE